MGLPKLDNEAALDARLDEIAIVNVVRTVSHALDKKLWSLFSQLFSDDGTVIIDEKTQSWRSWVDDARSRAESLVVAHHQLGSSCVTHSGEGVVVETYVTAYFGMPGGIACFATSDPPPGDYHVRLGGRYADRMVLEDGAWRIASRRFTEAWRDVRLASACGPVLGAAAWSENRADAG